MSQYHFVHHKPTWIGLASSSVHMASSWQLSALTIPKECVFIATGIKVLLVR